MADRFDKAARWDGHNRSQSVAPIARDLGVGPSTLYWGLEADASPALASTAVAGGAGRPGSSRSELDAVG
ncbi:hypothetical protein ABZ897_54010 [Nonomuraea sp. NPDC046802]|uniref:hypothetical protein n=1 Tax=Nonomuraea sp. NPDC046802 TaxID=3154919 RepID=UPI0033CEB01E